MVLGSTYGPNGKGNSMPPELRAWPWSTVQLVTFGAPAVVGESFQDLFNKALPTSTRVWVTGDRVTTELRRPIGKSHKLEPPRDIIGSLNPHEPLAIRKSLIWWLKKMSPETLRGIPMADEDQPWKTFRFTKDLLNYLGRALRVEPTKERFRGVIFDCEEFLFTILDRLKLAYADIPAVVDDLKRLLKEYEIIAGETAKGMRHTPYTKLVLLINVCSTASSLPKEHKGIYDLIRLCILFNALSQDSELYTDREKFSEITKMLALRDILGLEEKKKRKVQ
jgi:hypothetical protein